MGICALCMGKYVARKIEALHVFSFRLHIKMNDPVTPQELQQLAEEHITMELVLERVPHNNNNLFNKWNEMTDIAYYDYLEDNTNIRIPVQDLWIYKLWHFRQILDQQANSAELLYHFEKWCRAHQIYRDWLSHSSMTQEELCNSWAFLMSE